MKAFPSKVIDDEAGIWDVKDGMDLRDYFAAKAMQAMNANSAFDDTGYNSIAEEAYRQADAMLEAREK